MFDVSSLAQDWLREAQMLLVASSLAPCRVTTSFGVLYMLPAAGAEFQASSAPFVMVFWNRSWCHGPPSQTATVGEHVYSNRPIYGISNEQALCYSYTGSPKDPKSIKWTCDKNGEHLIQAAYVSEDCSGEELSDKRRPWAQGNRKVWQSGTWANILSSSQCLTTAGRSLSIKSNVPGSARPYCVQSTKAMEDEITDLVYENEADEKRLKQEEASLAQGSAQDRRDRVNYFLLGCLSGFLAGAFTVIAYNRIKDCDSARRRRCTGSRDLSLSMLEGGPGDAHEGGFAELQESPQAESTFS